MNQDIIKVLQGMKPMSIFVYGSQSNDSQNSKSDFEIGMIFADDQYVSRAEIRKQVPDKNYNVFPFRLSEIQNYTLDTPFQKNIYIASLISGNSKTIYGSKIIENLKVPKITKQDLLMDTSFNLGYALSAVRVMKEGLMDLANEMFYKSMFFATRNLIFATTQNLISGYKSIYQKSEVLEIPLEYRQLLEKGNKLRNEELTEIDSSLFYKNISYINKFVLPLIEKAEIE